MCNNSKRSTHLFLGDLDIFPGKLVSIAVLGNAVIYALKPNQTSWTLNVLILPVKPNTTYRIQKFLQLHLRLLFVWSDFLVFPMWYLTEQIFKIFYFTVFPLPCASVKWQREKLVFQWHSGLCTQMIPWEKSMVLQLYKNYLRIWNEVSHVLGKESAKAFTIHTPIAF